MSISRPALTTSPMASASTTSSALRRGPGTGLATPSVTKSTIPSDRTRRTPPRPIDVSIPRQSGGLGLSATFQPRISGGPDHCLIDAIDRGSRV
jgi:hypothetical protein